MYIKKILVGIAIAGLVVGGVIVYNIYQSIFAVNTQFNNKEAFVQIRSTDGISDVVSYLEPLLKDVESFKLVAQKKGYVNNIKAGNFKITKGMNNNEIINSLRSGNIPVKLSFNNQERVENLAGRVAQQIEADSVSLVKSFNNPEFLKANGFTKETKLSMYLPNSYEFYWNTSADQFRNKMLKEYQRFWNAKRKAQAKKLNMTPQQVISLAAIVHKETAKVEERPRVAGLYLNRLRKGILLQADPTVIYALKLHQNNFDAVIKRVLLKDLEVDSKYNTYKYAGVPPGPITMPDISAINAVLNAEKHDYLYMVADVKNFGFHKFAKTLAQHNQNAKEYHQWINKMGVKR